MPFIDPYTEYYSKTDYDRLYLQSGEKTIDLWNDKLLYGRVDEFQNSVYISNQSLEQKVKQLDVGPPSLFALNFVADAFNGFKNHIGLFGYPNIICINAAFLKSLPSREIKSGFAEVIKHALIQDKIYWEAIQSITDVSEMEWNSCITRSVGVKKKVVDQDPFENGIRKALNFGHTLGHAFETYLLNTEQHLLHGEAVALGMIIEAYLSNKKGLLSDSDLQSIVSFIIQIYGKANIEGYDWNQLLACMGQDKKNVSNKISFTLLNGIGDVVIDQHFETAAILEAVEYYQSL